MSETKLTQLPNILMIISDQDRATQHYPPHWEEQNLQAMTLLKKHGLTFINGFCNACMCSPSRATLFTGVYPAQHGVTDTLSFGFRASVNETELDPNLGNLAKMLYPHYEVQFRGKWHLSKGGLNQIHPEKSLMAADVAIYGFQGWTPPDAGENVRLENFGGGYANHDENYIQQAIEYVETYQRRREEGKVVKPFFLVVSLVNPHDVLSYPTTYQAGGYTEDDLEGDIFLPGTVDEDLFNNYKPPAQGKALTGMAIGEAGLGPIVSPAKKKHYINFYANLQKLIDQEISKLMACFYDLKTETPNKLAEETLIVRLADHGEMGTAHGGLRQKSFNTYEETMRIPYIFSNPVLYQREYRSEELASLIDIVPTLAGLLNKVAIDNDLHFQVIPPDNIKGADLSPVLVQPTTNPGIQESVMFTYDDVRAGQAAPMPAANRIRCIRTHKWKYARYFHETSSYPPAFELYFLQGIHKPVAQISQKRYDKEQEKLRGLAQEKGTFDPEIFERSLELFMHLQCYEVVNLAYTDPTKNHWVQAIIDSWDGVYSAAQIVDYLDTVRGEMAHALQKREQDLLISQPQTPWNT